jgi:hypothetical protein
MKQVLKREIKQLKQEMILLLKVEISLVLRKEKNETNTFLKEVTSEAVKRSKPP